MRVIKLQFIWEIRAYMDACVLQPSEVDCRGRIGPEETRNVLPSGGSRRIFNPALQRFFVGVLVRLESVRLDLCRDCSG